MKGQKVKGVGTDCVGFIVGVMEEMVGDTLDHAPLADAFQVRNSFEKSLRMYLKAYPAYSVSVADVEAGDVLLIGRDRKGLEHVLMVGNDNLWHCGSRGVSRAGLNVQSPMVLKKVLRYRYKETW
jgi:hypothetical protein